MTRTVQYSRGTDRDSDFNVFLFKEESSAISYAKELLLLEYDEQDLFSEYFKHKAGKLINYSDPIGTNWFLIKVEQKEIA